MVSKLAAAIAFFFLLASLAVIVTVAVIQIHKKSYVSPGLKYGIVLDAGSSRTTVYVYQWPAEKENNTGVVNQTLRAETTGSLDLGGASTQIAFSPEQDSKPNSTIAVVMYGYEYQVYTHSFQCYGRDEAEKRLLAALVQKSSGKSYAENPCYPQYYNTTVNAKYIFGSQCTAAQRPADYNPNQQLTILGTGDPALCRKEVLSMFNFTACPGEPECSFDGVYQPDITGKFVLQEMHSSVKKIYLKSYCFSANYIYSLLVNGYKFNAQSWMQISFQREVDNSSISWSLGYMLNLTNMIPAEADLVKLPMTSSVFAGLLFMFSMLAILSLMFLVISVVRSC
ncbi:UNVERIFIED_CONTAM: hypothetical protein FKN15_072517 [Acipenser sinensis]